MALTVQAEVTGTLDILGTCFTEAAADVTTCTTAIKTGFIAVLYKIIAGWAGTAHRSTAVNVGFITILNAIIAGRAESATSASALQSCKGVNAFLVAIYDTIIATGAIGVYLTGCALIDQCTLGYGIAHDPDIEDPVCVAVIGINGADAAGAIAVSLANETLAIGASTNRAE